MHLLVELSTIAAVDQRGADYILDCPDVVIAAQDVDATRRLFETRTKWPGTRHARLAIANALSDDIDNAYRHTILASEWIWHYRQQDHKFGVDSAHPEQLDIAAIPFCLVILDRAKDAIRFMRGWKDWFAYECCEHLFSLLQQAQPQIILSGRNLSGFWNNLTDDIGIIAAAVSFLEPADSAERSQLIKKLSNACNKKEKIGVNDSFYGKTNYRLQDGLLKASVTAASLGLGQDALAICGRMPHERPNIWSFQGHYSDENVFLFLAHAALSSAVDGNELRERDLLPKELYELSSGLGNVDGEAGIGDELKKLLAKLFQSRQEQSKEQQPAISYELKNDAERFINDRLAPLLKLTRAFGRILGAPNNEGDKAFMNLLEAWAEARRKPNPYTAEKFDRFFQHMGLKFAVFALWARADLKAASVRMFIEHLHEQEGPSVATLIEVVATLAKRSHLQLLAGEQAVLAKSLIETEYNIDTRASFYAQLARAILPASREEAAAYFKVGLEQMDAIGSGDYQFANELLLFAACLKGDELPEQDFHTLTNICELNMPFEEEKFPWFAFARGLSRTSGCKSLAKLARWDDRSKVSLDYTLLPCLTALINDNKIAPEEALALQRLSNPVELWTCNTETLAKAMAEKKYPNKRELVTELIKQFENNNPGIPMDSTVETLASIAEDALGKESETSAYLSAAHKHFRRMREQRNDHLNYHGTGDPVSPRRKAVIERQNRTRLRKLAENTNPTDAISMGHAIDALNEIQYIYDLKKVFFEELRNKVPFSGRPQYVQVLSNLENLHFYTKLDELKKCKNEWQTTSAGLASTLEALGIPLLQLHEEDFVSYNQLSGYLIKELSDVSGLPMSLLAVELIKIFARSETSTAASVWLALASFICNVADVDQGRSALKRLLNSNSAKLASNVVDGEWKAGLYPANDPTEIGSGLVWRMLGSPSASDRWEAAHSLRCFAKFDRWNVIDGLVAKFPTKEAYPFQASELPFYYLHARLWLLIAIARIAIDYPKKIARYQEMLVGIILDEDFPHVLMRHFAAQAVLACIDSGNLDLSPEMEKQIRGISISPFPRFREKAKGGMRDSFYQSRPKGVPSPKNGFHLDYDFDKHDVHNLSDVFGRPGWEIRDLIAEVAHDIDPSVTSMYDTGGRGSGRKNSGLMTTGYHSYGQHLGWHALFLVAGRLLRQYPVTDDSYYDDPWTEWLSRNLLTRNDGLWLADGMDRVPLSVQVNLLEKGEKELVLTGSKEKLLNLVGISQEIDKEIVVEGHWSSHDDIDVSISSALVAPRAAKALAKELIQEEPFSAWLPTYSQSEDEGYFDRKKSYVPWVVRPTSESGLDEGDPLASDRSMRRPRLTRKINERFSLKSEDPFGRDWKNPSGKLTARSEAWGHANRYNDEPSGSGARLLCSGELLKDVLSKIKMNILILIRLQRYEKGIGTGSSNFFHTIAVIRISENLDFEFYMGSVNKLLENKY